MLTPSIPERLHFIAVKNEYKPAIAPREYVVQHGIMIYIFIRLRGVHDVNRFELVINTARSLRSSQFEIILFTKNWGLHVFVKPPLLFMLHSWFLRQSFLCAASSGQRLLAQSQSRQPHPPLPVLEWISNTANRRTFCSRP